jgi:phosphatidylglycerol:prolipoprotein diacylglycerol transferase
VEPVPTSFHVGPLLFHTYGFGLAIAAYVAYRYCERRLISRGLGAEKFGSFTIVMVVLGVFGARVAHVVTNWSYYQIHPGQFFAVWEGGLSSFGGIVLAAPVGYILVRKWWPSVRPLVMADALIPAIVAGWALGRFLGPQFMVAGGGHLTHQWFGLRYAGQVGKRVPVPLIQGTEDGLLWLSLIFWEHRRRVRVGLVSAVALVVWGVVRTLDERYLLDENGHTGSVAVQIAGVALALFGAAIAWRVTRSKPVPVKD